MAWTAEMKGWAKAGVLDRLCEEQQRQRLIRIRIEAVRLDSTTVTIHPDGTGALERTDRSPSQNRAANGQPAFIWLPRMLGTPSRSP